MNHADAFPGVPDPLANLQAELGPSRLTNRGGLFAPEVEDLIAEVADAAIAADTRLDRRREAIDPTQAAQHAHVRHLLAVNHGRRLRRTFACQDGTPDLDLDLDLAHAYETRFKARARLAADLGAGPFTANLTAYRALEAIEATS